MDPIKDLKAESDLAFDVQLQKQNLLEACRARQIMAYSGGLFLVDESLISFLKSLKDLNVTDTVLLDKNQNPIKVRVEELLDRSLERYQEAVNTYHRLYENIRR